MDRGVAFIRGIGMFGSNNYTKEDMHYASAGKIMEDALERKFGKKFYVTTRSMSTIKAIAEKFGNQML